MKKIQITAILTVALLGITVGAPKLADVSHETVDPIENNGLTIVNQLSTEREEWLQKLIQCESSGNPNAINPVDLDGTPSYGILQFKESTFEAFSKAYKIEGELMDPEAQKAIVRKMMDDPSIKWEKQFPACVTKHIGWPPGVLH